MVVILPAIEVQSCAYSTCGDWCSRWGDIVVKDTGAINLVYGLVFVDSTMQR
jgi:hypothetical protein